MANKTLRSNLLLLLTAAIWGFAFVAQRVGMEHVGPFTFNGVRFALGSLSLVPLIFYFNRNKKSEGSQNPQGKSVLTAGIIAGSVLFIAASLQQVGLIYTSAGKAAFITSLYIILVPILGLFLKQHIGRGIWAGASVSLLGLYLLSVTEQFTVSKGDVFELASTVFWAAHILIIGYFSVRVDVLKLSCLQFATCSLLSLVTALLFENINPVGIYEALIPILYGGIGSVGIAYTLQVIGQKNAKASHAAIIMSMENVFAALGGFLILHETLGVRGILGCALMFSGLLVSQLKRT